MDLSCCVHWQDLFCMLIKLRIEFYQVQCDAFVNLATELLDIRPKFRRAIARVCKSLLTQSPEGYISYTKPVQGVDIRRRRDHISLSRRQWKVNQRATHSRKNQLR